MHYYVVMGLKNAIAKISSNNRVIFFHCVKVPIKIFVYKIQVYLIHTILRYGDYNDFMDR